MNTTNTSPSPVPAVSLDAVQPVRRLERKVCTRCGGTGRYSWCSMYGDRCFKCGGQKEYLTKRGHAASEYLTKLRSKPVEQVVAGDVIQVRHGMLGNILSFDTVVSCEVITEQNACVRHMVNGVPTILDGYKIETTSERHGGHSREVSRGEWIRVAQTAEQKLATLEQALAYQDTLKADGTPRKSKGVAP